MDAATTNNIIKARKSIKGKLEALKRHDRLIEKSFAPITAPLRTIVAKIDQVPITQSSQSANVKSGPKTSESKIEEVSEDEENDADDTIIDSYTDDLDKSDSNFDEEYIDKLHELPKYYVSGLIHDTKDSFDVKYGVRYNPEMSSFYIGDSEIRFVDENVLVKDREYKGTRGLFELIFKQSPSRIYTIDDEKKYANIIKDTNATRLMYDSSKPISGGNSWKYKHIIKPIVEKYRHRGGDLMISSSQSANVKSELNKSQPKSKDVLEEEENDADDTIIDNYTDDLDKPDFNFAEEYLDKLHDIPKYYVSGLIHDTKHNFDVKYGVRYNPYMASFYIGDSEIRFVYEDMLVKDREYEGTEGLFELVFKKRPLKIYTIDDEKKYANIIKDTNATRLMYDPSNPISDGNSWKYKNIIKPILEKHCHRGSDLIMESSNNAIDYVYWNDPNELVDRIRLLLASQEAGNFNHINEINSILEELLEAKLIAPID